MSTKTGKPKKQYIQFTLVGIVNIPAAALDDMLEVIKIVNAIEDFGSCHVEDVKVVERDA